jgi:serine/threonine protein kinase
MTLGQRGPWKKLKAIGKGSFGSVYLVQKSSSDVRYVMKEVSLRGLPRAEAQAAQNEVTLLKKLRHPHIISIEEALVVDDTLCIVMEWAEGKDLGALVAQRKQANRPFTEQVRQREGPRGFFADDATAAPAPAEALLPPSAPSTRDRRRCSRSSGSSRPRACQPRSQTRANFAHFRSRLQRVLSRSPGGPLGYRLAYCHHDLHMLHRDLKPQNVFLAANGDVKLGDFGLAKVIEATCALAKTQCGTPVYMSPELCLGHEYNRAADTYALGCVLYELMTLQMPWADVNPHAAGGISALLKKIANSSLDLSLCKRRYSAELCALLASLLHKRAPCRPALDQVLQIDLVKRAAPPPPPPAEKPLPPSWRKVPSASRPGQLAYLHVPTGYKQSFPPERDELPPEVLAALAKATFAPAAGGAPAAAGGARPPPTAQKPPPVDISDLAGGGAQAAPAVPISRVGAAPGPTAPRAAPREAWGAAPAPRAGTPPTAGGDVALPPNWRKVPSSSRPGSFSYLHLPTGYKQADVPTTDAPAPELLAAWKRARAQGTAARPPTAVGGAPPQPAARPAYRPLEPVKELPNGRDAVRQPDPQQRKYVHQHQQPQPQGQRPPQARRPIPIGRY